MAIKKNEILFANLSIDGGRTSLIQGTTDMCEAGAHINQHIRVKMGCERRPRAPDCDYTGSDLALFISLWRLIRRGMKGLPFDAGS